MITFNQITKQYPDKLALNQLSLKVQSHEFFVLVGPSGSGKTTLLKMINRLETPTSGSVSIDDKNVNDLNLTKLRQNIGYVLQSGALFPNMTVFQNAAIQLANLNWEPEKQHDRVAELLTEVGLPPKEFMTKMPHELSGGEAQRVGIVRALAASPMIVLMDGPFSALDPVSTRQLQDLVLQLHQTLATTFVFVTHDMQEAIKLADHLAVIHNGELQQIGTPNEILAAPTNDFVKNFFRDASQQKAFLARVIESGLGQPKSHQKALVLQQTDTIMDWATILHRNPAALIEVANVVLVPTDFPAYIATMKKGDH